MADAPRDGNNVPTLLAASSADGETPIAVYADPDTHRLLVQLAAGSSGTGAPATTPIYIGQVYVDTDGPDIYMAAGTASSSDWVLIYSAP
jgi:hypothetical protein